MGSKLKRTSIILVVLLIIILLAAFYLKNKEGAQFPTFINNAFSSSPLLWFKKPPNPENVRCAMDVKCCPDGSCVGRVAPSCSFAPCPEENKY